MYDSWDRHGASAPEPVREFLVAVELYISNAAGVATTSRKTGLGRKRFDRRDAGEDGKLKEKGSTNWTPLQKNLSSTGQWRPATCRLLEEGDRCLLNVYLDESILYQTISIHLLNQTDIRLADNTLFYRKDCLGIFCLGGQRWTSSHTAEPLYIQFANAETCTTWQTLLKSYAIPEIYGRWFFPVEGGSYRMWRQVELTVMQGRNLGICKLENGPYGIAESSPNETDGSDLDVSCEIHVSDILCGRTTVKKGVGAPDWHENFVFTGLPPFECLDIVVWKEKKQTKPSIVGKCRVVLGNFKRGDTVEGWFPLIQDSFVGTEIHAGELRVKIRVDEEIILPYQAYSKLMQLYNSRNFLDWMADLESRLKVKTISSHLMNLAMAQNIVIEQVRAYAAREVEASAGSAQTLFRGNTTLTKVVELCMTWYGKNFLEASIGSVLRRLCAEKVSIEVDPVRSGKGTRDVERNVDSLIHWAQEFWNQIYSVRSECPNEMRILFRTIRKLVEERYQPDPNSLDTTNSSLKWQSVSAFIFLRFIVPAILHPHLFGLCAGLPAVPIQRSLTLIAKVVQRLANLNATSQKEPFMRGVEDFLQKNLPAMVEYITVVSSPLKEAPPANPQYTMNPDDRLGVVNALRQRTKKMTVLDREAIPILPQLLDIPKSFAIIISAVIRAYRDLKPLPKTNNPEIDAAVEEFCQRCYEVEKEALRRVKELAAKLANEHQKTLFPPEEPNTPTRSGLEPHEEELPNSPISVVTSTVVSAGASSTSTAKSKRARMRPSTAPSQSDSGDSERRQMFENSPTLVRAIYPDLPSPTSHNRSIHAKAPSTDSVPSFVSRDPFFNRPQIIPPAEPPAEELGRRKKGLQALKGILRR